MSAPPLVPNRLYGLRTWTAVGAQGDERLAGPQRGTVWPADGGWLAAGCSEPHTAPAPACRCGIHAWHPGRHGARQMLRPRWEIPGVVEAEGTIELHQDGFRAARGRPYALFVAPNANASLIGRLAEVYGAELVHVDDAEGVCAWCATRGLGLAQDVVERLIGPERLAAERGARRRRARRTALRLASVAVVIAALIGAGLAVTSDPGDRSLYGRTGEVERR